MRIIILSDSDSGGGAAIAAFRLHQALRKYGILSFLIVRVKRTADPFVIAPNKFIDTHVSKLIIYINRLFAKIFVENKHTLFTYNFFSIYWIKKTITKIDPDVINIHWINENLLSYNDIEKIKCPIIFTLHDMNLFTGGCHYNSNCTKFITSCKKCPVLKFDKFLNLASYLQFTKTQHLNNINKLVILGPSKWICEEAKKSIILNNHRVINLPNPLNVEKFSPLKHAKTGKKKILFGAINSLDDKRKGLTYLCEAINLLNPDVFSLEIFGNKDDNIKNIVKGFEVNFYGHLTNEEDIINLYRCSDVFVVPSMQENFSNAILEALSCGLPVVCFNIGGNSDMVIDKFNGYLAKPFQSEDLSNGIDWCVKNYVYLSTNATKYIKDNFSERIIYKQYLDIIRNEIRIN